MGDKDGAIEWTDRDLEPDTGLLRVSEGCL